MVEVRCTWAAGADTSLGLPTYATAGAAGADLRANLMEGEVILAPGERALVSTGLHVEIAKGFEGQVRPRSGLALKHGVTLPNTPGTIDSDYRGVLGVILANTGTAPFKVEHGMRIAQLVIAPVTRAHFTSVDGLSATARGAGGFGSTGVG